MNKQAVYLDRWMSFHPYCTPSQSDYYYLKICNEIREIAKDPDHEELAGLFRAGDIRDFSCFIVCYLEDVVSGAGIWKAFIRKHMDLYGKFLPFYEPDEYYEDEINPEDVSFLIWYYLSMVHYETNIINPLNPLIEWLGMDIYEVLEREYEHAPENPGLSEFLRHDTEQEYYEIRTTIQWIVLDSYLFHFNRGKYEEQLEKTLSGESNEFIKENREMLSFEIMDSFLISKYTPLLALQGKDWLAGILGREHPLYEDVMDISDKKSGFFLYLNEDDSYLYFRHIASDTVLPVTKKSLSKHESFRPGKTVVHIGFVKWKGEWWFSGIYSVWDDSKDIIRKEKNSSQSRSLFGGDPEKQREQLKVHLDVFLKYNNGKQIAFLKDVKETEGFIHDYISFLNQSLDHRDTNVRRTAKEAEDQGLFRSDEMEIDSEGTGIPGMVFFNPGTGVEVAFGFTGLIPDPGNPYYEKDETKRDSLRLLFSPVISREFALYLLENYDLAGIEFPDEDKDENLLRENLDFMLRFWKVQEYHSKPRLTIL